MIIGRVPFSQPGIDSRGAKIGANARLRTDPGNPVTTPGSLRPTSYLQELNRLMITHS